MYTHRFLATAAAVVTALTVFPATSPAQNWTKSGNNIYNNNSGRVGVGVMTPGGRLHVGGRSAFNGDLVLAKTHHSIIFGTKIGPTNEAMLYQFANGSSNADRMVLAHSPAFSNWGLQYQDVGDRYRFLRAGSPVVTFDLGADLVRHDCDLSFGSDQDGIAFSNAVGTSAPMVTMFPSGSSNADRMVLAHSPAFTNWGLQYRDLRDEFRFMANGSTVMSVDLGSRGVTINSEVTTPLAALQVGDSGDGSGIITNAYNVFSSRKFKKDIEQMTDTECGELLDAMVSTPVFKYRYKGEGEDVHRHVGVMVEDSPKNLLAPNNISVDLSRYVGSLHAALKAQQAQIEALQQQVESIVTADS